MCDDGIAHTFVLTSATTPDTGLKGYDSGIKLLATEVFGDADSYCLGMTVGNKHAMVVGPGGTVVQNAPAAMCTNANG